MKKIIILILIKVISVNIAASKESDKPLSLTEAVVAVADSMRANYINHLHCNIGDSLKYDFGVESRSSSLYLPRNMDKETEMELYTVLDSLARTDVFQNKLVMAEVTHTLLYTYSNKDLEEWQKKIAVDLTLTYMNYSLRVINRGSIVLSSLPGNLYTPEIISNIRKLFQNPYITEQEAKISINGYKPRYSVEDTTGLAELQSQPYRELSRDDKNRLMSIENTMYRADKENMTLKQYYDSLNTRHYKRAVEIRTGRQIGLHLLIKVFGRKYIYELAPMIDSVCQSTLFDERKIVDCGLELARLDYKDYQQKQIEKYSNNIDSIINKANKKTLSSIEALSLAGHLRNYFDNLWYINTQEAISKTAPILLVDAKFNSEIRGKQEIIGSQFFLLFNSRIKNFPYDKEKEREIISKMNDEEMPREFLEEMYNWMVENVGNYELDE